LDTNQTYNAEQRALYDISRKGPYTITRGLSTNLGLTSFPNASSKYKDVIAAGRNMDPASLLPPDTDPRVIKGYKAQREVLFNQLSSDEFPVGMLHWSTSNSNRVYFTKPLSRGTITLNSTNPLDHPLIDWRSCTDPTDWAVNIAVLRKNREIMNAPAIKVLGLTETAPLGDNLQTDEELKAAMRGLIDPGGSAHPCCSAAMMPRDLGGVLDEKMRVYGVTGLRVIDASYWPLILGAAPSATTYASGEKVCNAIIRGLADATDLDVDCGYYQAGALPC
jgi:choline dehydrogenase